MGSLFSLDSKLRSQSDYGICNKTQKIVLVVKFWSAVNKNFQSKAASNSALFLVVVLQVIFLTVAWLLVTALLFFSR